VKKRYDKVQRMRLKILDYIFSKKVPAPIRNLSKFGQMASDLQLSFARLNVTDEDLNKLDRDIVLNDIEIMRQYFAILQPKERACLIKTIGKFKPDDILIKDNRTPNMPLEKARKRKKNDLSRSDNQKTKKVKIESKKGKEPVPEQPVEEDDDKIDE